MNSWVLSYSKIILDDKIFQITLTPWRFTSCGSTNWRVSGNPAGCPRRLRCGMKRFKRGWRVERSITNNIMKTFFLATLFRGRTKLSFGILYMNKVLYDAFQEKFPEKDVLKVIGNLVY